MIPWPLAALSILYGLLAFLSAVRLVECIVRGMVAGVVWAALWSVLAGATAVGLPAQREWARKCAVIGAALFLTGAVVSALVLVVRTPPHPKFALLDTLLAGVALVVIRYLRRPVIKSKFS